MCCSCSVVCGLCCLAVVSGVAIQNKSVGGSALDRPCGNVAYDLVAANKVQGLDGAITDTKFTILQCLGCGGTGCVYSAKFGRSNVADTAKVVKVIPGATTDADKSEELLLKGFAADVAKGTKRRECWGKQLGFTKIIKSGTVTVEDQQYVVQIIDKLGSKGILKWDQQITKEQFLHIQLLSLRAVLVMTHIGIMHRDMQASNIAYTVAGKLTLFDFGNAKGNSEFSSDRQDDKDTDKLATKSYYVDLENVAMLLSEIKPDSSKQEEKDAILKEKLYCTQDLRTLSDCFWPSDGNRNLNAVYGPRALAVAHEIQKIHVEYRDAQVLYHKRFHEEGGESDAISMRETALKTIRNSIWNILDDEKNKALGSALLKSFSEGLSSCEALIVEECTGTCVFRKQESLVRRIEDAPPGKDVFDTLGVEGVEQEQKAL